MKTNEFCSRRKTLREVLTGTLAIVALALVSGAQAQAWPTRNVMIVVPAAPGGGPDLLARALAERLSATSGKVVIVENRPGANAILGSQVVAEAAPDGHTLLLVDRLTLAVNPLLYSKLPYSSRQLTGVTEVARVDLLWVTRADAPYKTWSEMVALARKGAETIAVGTSARGSSPHLSLELVIRELGVSTIISVPYRGVSQAVIGLLAGDVQAMITGPVPVLGHIRAGTLRALVIGSNQRLPLLPDVPTLREAGAPGDLLISTHFTLHAPALTPAATIEKINATVRTVLAEPAFVKQFEARGLVVGASRAEDVESGIAADSARLTKMIKDMDLKGSSD